MGGGCGGDLAPSLLAAALELARQGHPVLPLHTPTVGGCSCGKRCGRTGKHPRDGYGLTHASTDTTQIEQWWRSSPDANVGMRCDQLVVLDVDGADGTRSLAELEAELGRLPGTWEQATGRGRHLLFRASVNGNSTAALGSPPGLDLRGGARGYVVCAPSLHASGRRYQQNECPPAPLPVGWLQRLERPEPKPEPQPVSTEACAVSTAYGRAALDGELRRLLLAPQGDRNNTLNRCAFRLAQLCAGGELEINEMTSALYTYALRAGLDPDEIRPTLRAATRAGLRHPRSRR